MLCVSSIKDQKVAVQHIIVDACSSDGTQEYLKKIEDINIMNIIEHDNGMYEAINKGIRHSNNNIIGHLNCDEQYLPGTLKFIKNVFDRHKEIDIVYGNYFTINNDGTLNSFKKLIPYRKYYVLSGNLYIATCALFYRKHIFENGCFFDPQYRSCGDKEFIIRLHDLGYKSLHIDRYLSCYTVTGNNLSQLSSHNKDEEERILKKYNKMPINSLWMFQTAKKIEKYLKGAYQSDTKMSYSIYTLNSNKKRVTFNNQKGTYITKYDDKVEK